MTIENKIISLYKIAPAVEDFTNMENFKKLVKLQKEDCMTVCDLPLVNLARLIYTLESEQRMQGAKKSGKGNALKVAEKILKRVPDYRESLQFANIIDGKQYICDGYICVCYSEGNHLPLEEMPSNLQPIDNLPEFFADMDGIDIELPELKSLKNYIKMQKSLHKGEKNYHMTFDFGVGRFQVDAQFLAEIIEMLPEAKAKMQERMLVFEDENDNKGIVMCIRIDSTGKRTEI